MEDKLGLKKIKFYDTLFKILLVTSILFFIGLFFFLTSDSLIFIIIFGVITLLMGLSLAIINWGMIYNMVKGKYMWWILLTIISIFFGGFPIIAIIFYFAVMKKNFREGDFNHEPGIFSEQIWKN